MFCKLSRKCRTQGCAVRLGEEPGNKYSKSVKMISTANASCVKCRGIGVGLYLWDKLLQCDKPHGWLKYDWSAREIGANG